MDLLYSSPFFFVVTQAEDTTIHSSTTPERAIFQIFFMSNLEKQVWIQKCGGFGSAFRKYEIKKDAILLNLVA